MCELVQTNQTHWSGWLWVNCSYNSKDKRKKVPREESCGTSSSHNSRRKKEFSEPGLVFPARADVLSRIFHLGWCSRYHGASQGIKWAGLWNFNEVLPILFHLILRSVLDGKSWIEHLFQFRNEEGTPLIIIRNWKYIFLFSKQMFCHKKTSAILCEYTTDWQPMCFWIWYLFFILLIYVSMCQPVVYPQRVTDVFGHKKLPFLVFCFLSCPSIDLSNWNTKAHGPLDCPLLYVSLDIQCLKCPNSV